MGGQQCKELVVDTYKKSAAYGIYELVLQKDYEYAVVSKSINKGSVSIAHLRNELQKRKKIQSSNLVNLCLYEMAESDTFIDLKMHYEYVPLTLAERVEGWKALKKEPSEAQISNLLLGIQGALKELYDLGIGHRCINFDTVLCWQSLYKLTDISMLTFLTGYDFERQGDKKQFLSPHLLNYLYYQGTQPKYGLEDDLFSLAMLIIAIVLGCDPQQLYFIDSWNAKKVNIKKLQNGRQILKDKYRPWIEQKVGSMLQNSMKGMEETPKKSTTSRKNTISAL